MIRCASLVAVAGLVGLMTVSCGGEPEPGTADTEQAVDAAMVRLGAAPGSDVDFGTVALGSSKVETFAVTNIGTQQSTGAITLAFVAGSSAFSMVPPVPGECVNGATVLPPGASCQVRVLFSGTSLGSNIVIFRAFSPIGGAYTITLKANVQSPAMLVISPASFDFGSVAVGSRTATETFTVTNMGQMPANNLAFSVSQPGWFNLQSLTCGSSLGGGLSCTMSIFFAPTVHGAFSAQVQATGNLGGVAVANVTGFGI